MRGVGSKPFVVHVVTPIGAKSGDYTLGRKPNAALERFRGGVGREHWGEEGGSGSTSGG